MTDKRELILSRLFTILQGIQGVATDPYTGGPCVYRNRDQLPDQLRPGILLLDGDEEANQTARQNQRPGKSPNLMTIKPEVYVSLTTAKPDNTTIGADLNAFRILILKAVLTDNTLQGYCDNGGELWYNATITDLARGRAMMGEMGLAFWLTYALIPSQL
jgi:hypothetical protein